MSTLTENLLKINTCRICSTDLPLTFNLYEVKTHIWIASIDVRMGGINILVDDEKITIPYTFKDRDYSKRYLQSLIRRLIKQYNQSQKFVKSAIKMGMTREQISEYEEKEAKTELTMSPVQYHLYTNANFATSLIETMETEYMQTKRFHFKARRVLREEIIKWEKQKIHYLERLEIYLNHADNDTNHVIMSTDAFINKHRGVEF